MQQSRVALFSKDIPAIPLHKLIKIPANVCSGLAKCRIVFGEKIHEISYIPYEPKIINSLKLVKDNSMEYSHKLLDRNNIIKLYDQRGDCDDIIIVKDGMLTDSSYSNIALRKDDRWYTPSTCLLNGTRRQQLIDQGRLVVTDISVHDMHQYDKVSLINAMMGLGKIEVPSIKIFHY